MFLSSQVVQPARSQSLASAQGRRTTTEKYRYVHRERTKGAVVGVACNDGKSPQNKKDVNVVIRVHVTSTSEDDDGAGQENLQVTNREEDKKAIVLVPPPPRQETPPPHPPGPVETREGYLVREEGRRLVAGSPKSTTTHHSPKESEVLLEAESDSEDSAPSSSLSSTSVETVPNYQQQSDQQQQRQHQQRQHQRKPPPVVRFMPPKKPEAAPRKNLRRQSGEPLFPSPDRIRSGVISSEKYPSSPPQQPQPRIQEVYRSRQHVQGQAHQEGDRRYHIESKGQEGGEEERKEKEEDGDIAQGEEEEYDKAEDDASSSDDDSPQAGRQDHPAPEKSGENEEELHFHHPHACLDKEEEQHLRRFLLSRDRQQTPKNVPEIFHHDQYCERNLGNGEEERERGGSFFYHRCRFSSNGCRAALSDFLARHEKECAYRDVPCPDPNCDEEGTFKHFLQNSPPTFLF